MLRAACASIASFAIVLASSAGVTPRGLTEPASRIALVLLESQSMDGYRAAVAAVEGTGGRAPQGYPPDAFVADLTPAAERRLRSAHPDARIEYGRVDADALTRAGAAQAARIWNAVYHGNAASAEGAQPSDQGTEMALPPLAPVAPGAFAGAAASQDSGGAADGAPGADQTSEFMAGSASYTVIFVESNGGAGACAPADPQTENWDSSRRSAVLSEISAGMAFWTSRQDAPSPLSFVLDNQGVRTTSCEPITRSGGGAGDEGKWIADVLASFGIATSPSDPDYFNAARQLAHQRRTALGTDWGFLIFVVDSLNDTDGMFTNGTFAYAYLNGPFMVMTYDNDGWGIGAMDRVAAHETGHIFGALDEYPGSGCSTADTWGYLNAANASCNNGGDTSDHSIMGASSEQVSSTVDVSGSARAAIGWRNPLGGVVDVVRTATAVIAPYAPDPTSDATPAYSGSAGNVAFPPGGCNTLAGHCWRQPGPATVSRVAAVEWNVDGGVFGPSGASATDGAFDEPEESFNFTASPMGGGVHVFGARGVNQFGHASPTATDALTISAVVSIDSDSDGCSDGEEDGPTPSLGGDRNKFDGWDFYDVSGDGSIDLSDTLLILEHFGHGSADDASDNALDRHAPDQARPWRSAAADDGVDLTDALTNLASFGHDCRAAP